MTITRIQAIAATVAVASALLLGACGSEKKSDTTTGTTVEATDTTAKPAKPKADGTTLPPTTTTAAPTTTTAGPTTTSTSTAPSGPPCTEAAIAAAFSSTVVVLNFVCDGGYAGAAVGDDNVTQGWVLTASGSSWTIVSPSPCGAASAGIPSTVLDAACFVD